ncbi:hypothetical protein D3C81_411980 [compost metagenome]
MPSQVVDQARIRRDLAVFAHGVVQVRVLKIIAADVALPVRQARTEDDRQRLRRTQAQGGIHAAFALLVVGAAQARAAVVGHRHVAIPGVDIRHRIVIAGEAPARIDRAVRLEFRGAHAQHQFMLAAEGLERAADIRVERGLLRLAVPVGQPQLHAAARQAVRVAVAGKALQGIVPVAAAAHGHLGDPVVVEIMVERGEQHALFAVIRAPRGRAVHRAGEARLRAVGIEHGEVAPRALEFFLLVVDAGAEHRRWCQVRFDDGVQHVLFLLVAVDEGALVFMRGDDARAHPAIGREWRRDVAFDAVAVPRAGLRACRGGKRAARTLAHQVDGCRRAARAADQARRAADDFNAVVDGHVEGACLQVLAGRDTVEHVRRHFEAA